LLSSSQARPQIPTMIRSAAAYSRHRMREASILSSRANLLIRIQISGLVHIAAPASLLAHIHPIKPVLRCSHRQFGHLPVPPGLGVTLSLKNSCTIVFQDSERQASEDMAWESRRHRLTGLFDCDCENLRNGRPMGIMLPRCRSPTWWKVSRFLHRNGMSSALATR
jgi:hypothetical protein